MNFECTESQKLLFESAYSFGKNEIDPFALEWENEQIIPKALLEKAGELGFAAMYVPEELRGSGMSRLEAAIVFEALAQSCPSVASFISIHNMCAWMIAEFGSAELKAKVLPDLCTFKKICSYCLTEPGSGSDAGALKTTARRNNNGYLLSGEKSFISGGGYSDYYIVMSRTGELGPNGISAILVEDGSTGLSFGKNEDKMGWKAQPTRSVILDNCFSPSLNLIGEEGKGFSYAMAGLDGGRINIAAAALGGAQEAFEIAKKYSMERMAFSKPISSFQSIQFKLADLEIKLESARTFLYKAAWKLDKKDKDSNKFCALAKKLVTDNAFEVSNSALQILGGYGYLTEYKIEKIVRDLRVHQILEGTNEIMQLIIARHILSKT